MDVLQTLTQKLRRHPELTVTERPNWLRIEAPEPNGFAVELYVSPNSWTVYLGEAGFHEDFSSSDEVLNFIAWCFSGEARVRELWRGSMPQKAILYEFRNGDWHEIAFTGYFFAPFWLKKRDVILANPCLLFD